jgi:hypothetical protein
MSVKKSLYIFLCCLLGCLLFLLVHQMLAFGYLMLLYYNYESFSFGLSLLDFLALDYFTLIIAVMGGAWYGIWLGIYWYGVVYEGSSSGFIGHLIRHYWPNREKAYGLKAKVAAVEERLAGDLWELEDLAEKVEVAAKVPAKKKIVKRKVVSKK